MDKSVKKQSFWEYFKGRSSGSAANIIFDVLIGAYLVFSIGGLIYFAVLGGEHIRDCLIALSYIAIVPIFYILEYALKIRSPLPFTLFVLVYCVFCFLGASFNFYTLIPRLDDILHMCWGILFSIVGLCIAKSLMGEPKTAGQFVLYILFAAGFCTILAIIWEIYEFATDSLLANFDMQEDTIVNHIHSFMMHDPYDHLHTWRIEGIARTELFDAGGNNIGTIEGGYLDLGLIDTMMDLIWCFVTTGVFAIILAVDHKLGGKLNKHIVPLYVGTKGKEE